nr:hypothetical protein [Chloroflexia bacterium]
MARIAVPTDAARAALAIKVVTRSMVTSLISKGKTQGYLLSDDIIAAFPHPEEQLEHLDDFYSTLVAEGIDVLDQAPIKPAPKQQQHGPLEQSHDSDDSNSAGANDSVRLYLQEIGATDLLTMREEVWLAKRMERGLLAEEALLAEDLSSEQFQTCSADKLDGDRARAH